MHNQTPVKFSDVPPCHYSSTSATRDGGNLNKNNLTAALRSSAAIHELQGGWTLLSNNAKLQEENLISDSKEYVCI